MKLITCNKEWCENINFVDKNDLILGYDLERDCCEVPGWFIAAEVSQVTIPVPDMVLPDDIDDYVFDPEFFQRIDDDLEENHVAVFRIVTALGDERFLHLFNCHNGYHAHWFTFKKGDETIQQGRL